LIGCSLPNPSSAKSLLKLEGLSGRASWGCFDPCGFSVGR
jgi:hypothetical protein